MTPLSCTSGVHINHSPEFRAFLEADQWSLHISVNHRRRQEFNLLFCTKVALDLTFDADEFPVEIAYQVPRPTHSDVVVFQVDGPFHSALDRQILLASNPTLDTDQFADNG